jgi:hypothetical protein
MQYKSYGLVLLVFGMLVLGNVMQMSYRERIFSAAVDRLQFDDTPVDNAFSAAEIDFGGDKDNLVKSYKRLLHLAAGPGDGRVNKTLTIAAVNISSERKIVETSRFLGIVPQVSQSKPRPITIDLGNAGTGAVVLIADRPVVWSAAHSQQGQRAKIAIEGGSVFDVENVSPGLLAGFRIASFGAKRTTDPADIDGTDRQKDRFCESMKIWAKHFDVDFQSLRIWQFSDPDVIALNGSTLTAEGGSDGGTRDIEDICGA